jgi:hypothetical protein
MAGTPRSIRIDDDIYSALIQCVAARKANGEDIDITKLINESLRLQMPIHVWDRLASRVTTLEQKVSEIKEKLDK